MNSVCSDWESFFSPVTSPTATHDEETDEPQPPPLPGIPRPAQDTDCDPPPLPKRRSSFLQRKAQATDPDVIRQELITWQCEEKRCSPCLSAVTCNDSMTHFAVNTIMNMREHTFERGEQSMRPYIRRQLASLLRKSRSTLQYVVAGVECCKAAWNWANGFAPATSNREHADFNRWWQANNPEASVMPALVQPISGVTHTCDVWLYRWIMLATHNPPNATKPSIPNMCASVLYPQYIAWCTLSHCSPTTKDAFRSRWSIIRREVGVKTRASKQGSAECDVCSMLKRAAHKAVSLQHKAAIQQLLGEHIKFTNGEVSVYDQHIFDAKDAYASHPSNPQVHPSIFHCLMYGARAHLFTDMYVVH